MKSFKKYLEESVGEAGLQYELKVYKAIQQANIKGLTPGDKPAAGFSNVGAGDIEARYNGKPFNVEVKLSARDQMGGTSFRYDMRSKAFEPVKELDPNDLEILLDAAKSKTKEIDAYLKAAQKLEPTQYHKQIDGLPVKVSKAGREILKNQGLLAKINKNIDIDIGFMIRHYNKKGVYYIQIGGAGLFYLGKNPFKLPVPPLKGSIRVEMRLAYAGGKLSFPDGTEARSAGLRLQARLLANGKSDYSLDNAASIKKMFAQ